MRRYLALYVAGLCFLAVAMGIAYQSGYSWAPAVAGGLTIMLGSLGAMLVKTSLARSSRSREPDSIEAVHDSRARAGAFVDILVAVSLALLIAVVFPGVNSSLLLFALLVFTTADYWIRRARLRAR